MQVPNGMGPGVYLVFKACDFCEPESIVLEGIEIFKKEVHNASTTPSKS